MALVNRLMNGLFDLLMQPWQTTAPWPGLIVASLFSAAIFVTLFHFTADQNRLRRARNRLVARTLELLLFQHDLRVSFSACGRILAANGLYLGQFLWPMSIGLTPLVLIFVQMECWFDRRPLHVGEPAVLTVALDPAYSVVDTPVEVRVSEQVRIDSPAVRVSARNELAWRVIAVAPGQGWIDVTLAGVTERKALVTGEQLARVSPRRVAPRWTSELFAPSEPPLTASSPVRWMEISYPSREISLGLRDFPWIVVVGVLMMVFSLILARGLGIRIV